MAGKDFEAFKQTIEQHFMGHPVVTQNAYTAWFARGDVPLAHLRQFTTQFSVFSNQFLLAALNRFSCLRRRIRKQQAFRYCRRIALEGRLHVQFQGGPQIRQTPQ